VESGVILKKESIKKNEEEQKNVNYI
jgi:hypothetical protein